MSLPIFLVGMGQSDYDDTTKYKKAGAVAASAGQSFSALRRFAESIREPFGAKDIFQSKVINDVIEAAQQKAIKYAIQKHPEAVAIVDARFKYDIQKHRVYVMLSGTVVVPRDSTNARNNNTKKNRSSRRNTRKNRK